MGWVVNATPRPLYPRERDPVPIVQDAGWAPGPVWTGAENLAPPTGIRSPDRPARSQSLYRLSYPDPHGLYGTAKYLWIISKKLTQRNPSGAYNLGVATRFLEDLFTLGLTNPLEGTKLSATGIRNRYPLTTSQCGMSDNRRHAT